MTEPERRAAELGTLLARLDQQRGIIRPRPSTTAVLAFAPAAA